PDFHVLGSLDDLSDESFTCLFILLHPFVPVPLLYEIYRAIAIVVPRKKRDASSHPAFSKRYSSSLENCALYSFV
ncbi:hypothetical protein, partial [uncultured Dubosiella sp.]|uniref:hypothetical protein n=1 Tax=uncultured Dubosiella sp. TaxID=1937011 RepID=UPI002730D63A